MANANQQDKNRNKVVAGVGLSPQSSSPLASSQAGLYDDSSTGLQLVDVNGGSAVSKVRVAITNAEMLALRATPKTLVAAPGAGKYLEFVGATIFFDRAGAYTESADNMAVKLGTGAGTAVSETIEATGLVDAAGDVVMPVKPATSAVIAKAAAENLALVLHNTGDGEYGGGNASNEIIVEVVYRVHATGF
jgi:hypothetical protein